MGWCFMMWTEEWEEYSVQLLSRVRLFATPWTTACQASLSITNSQSPPKPCPSSWWCHPTIPFSIVPFSCSQSFPASGSFPVSWLFESGGQSIRVSASVLPMNIQGWFPLGLTGLIPLLSKGLTRDFSSTTFQSISPSVLSLLYGPTLSSIHDYRKKQNKT